MIISENMGLEDFAAQLGELGGKKRKGPILKGVHRKLHKSLKAKTMPHAKKKGKKRKGGGAESPEAAEIDQVAVNPGDEPAYDPGYSEPLPGSDSGDEGNYNPGSEGEEALGPAAPGSDMEVDPYAPADGSGDEGDDEGEEGGEEGGEQAARPAPLPMAPSVAPVTSTMAPTSLDEGLPMWVWITGGALLAGGGIWWYLKKTGRI